MSDSQAEAVLRLAEVAHAAVHFGQLFTSMSHQGEIHRDYDELQKNYVLYGIKGARNLRDWAVRSAPDVTLKNLYDDFWDVLNSAEDNLDWAWEDRVESFAKKCIDVLKDFVRGEATTDDTKAQFKRMSTLFHEVSMSEAQVAAVLSLSELAHAAAHIGILTASMSHRGHIHRLYDFYQKGYVVYGIEMARLFIEKAESIWEDDDSEEDDESHPW